MSERYNVTSCFNAECMFFLEPFMRVMRTEVFR